MKTPAGPKVGSIPACAGEPWPAGIMGGMGKVYPRVCGGTPAVIPPIGMRRGLSPRVRGNRAAGRQNAEPLRSIPACAGEPFASLPNRVNHKVYPRVCGGTARSAAQAL